MQTTLKSIEPTSGPCAAAIELICVAPHLVDAIWPHARHLISKALERGRSDYTIWHIEKQLIENKSLLWIAAEGASIVAAMTTEICGRICVVTAFGSYDYNKVKQFWPDIYQFARNEGCDRVRLYGRPGWMRALKDECFQQPWVALEKRI